MTKSRFRIEIRRTTDWFLRWHVTCIDQYDVIHYPESWTTVTHWGAVHSGQQWLNRQHRQAERQAIPAEVIE